MISTYITPFLEKNIISVFFVYGLSLFFIAASIFLSYKSLKALGLARIFLYLLFFSITHGMVEWIDMYKHYRFILYGTDIGTPLVYVRFYVLTGSFYLLLIFGLTLLCRAGRITLNIKRYTMGLNAVFLLLLVLIAVSGFLNKNVLQMECIVRYLLGFPSALIVAIAFHRLSRENYSTVLPEYHPLYFRYTAYCFLLYGIFTGIIVPENNFFFAAILNQKIFLQYVGIPVQIFRMLAVSFMAYLIIRAMSISILHRLITTFVIFSVIPVILGISGYINLRLIDKSYKQVEKLHTEEGQFLYMSKSFYRLYDLLHNKNAYSNREAFSSPLIKEYAKEFGSALNQVKALEHEDKKEVILITRISETLDNALREGIENTSVEVTDRLKSMVNGISAIHLKEINENKREVSENFRIFNQVILVTFEMSFLGLIYIFYNFYKIIILPLNKLKTGVNEIGKGNLEHTINIHTGDEFQEVSEEFNKMGKRLWKRTKEVDAITNELKELSIRDGLTGLFNHRYFYNKLTEELNRAKRYASNLSILMLDIDDFKHYNDTNGHPEGDELLKAIGVIIRGNLRDTDIACRYGGEEFAIILPETEKESAVTFAERLRYAISNHEFSGKETQPGGNITVTIGVCSYPDDSLELRDIVKKADAALYRAKREGKNRVYYTTAGDNK